MAALAAVTATRQSSKQQQQRKRVPCIATVSSNRRRIPLHLSSSARRMDMMLSSCSRGDEASSSVTMTTLCNATVKLWTELIHLFHLSVPPPPPFPTSCSPFLPVCVCVNPKVLNAAATRECVSSVRCVSIIYASDTKLTATPSDSPFPSSSSNQYSSTFKLLFHL